MATVEVLAYAPKDMDEFLDFCLNGKRDDKGVFEIDEDGRKLTGVLRWLEGRRIKRARFFNSKKGDAMQLFVAEIEREENYDVPWMRRIPGFERLVDPDGLIGKIPDLADLLDLMATVKPNPDLDARFKQKREDLERVLERLSPSDQHKLLATLRGDMGTDHEEVITETNRTFNLSL